MDSFEIKPIGVMRSPFKDKFGIPRQAGLAKHAQGYVEIAPPYNQADAFRGLEDFSHLWLTFVFHLAQRESWKPMIRPPRLGGNRKIGVFAARSPFRPNNLGLSAVRLDRVEINGASILLHIRGADLAEGTPIVDIKPYLPYADSIADAQGGFAADPPTIKLSVHFSQKAHEQLHQIKNHHNFEELIKEVLSADPRPAYMSDDPERVYGVRLYAYDVRWRLMGSEAEVVEIIKEVSNS